MQFSEILEIIKTCREHGVESVEYNGFKATFRQDIAGWRTFSPEAGKPYPLSAYVPEPELLAEQEQRVKNIEVSEMPLTDPAQFEDLLAQGQLTPTEEPEES